MGKWGLFILSIGCLLVLFSANARTGEYDILSLITALFLIILSIFLIRKEKKNNKNNEA
ncbi:hypothetical protein ACS127_06685 [Amphibacillus sp. Q70]|uniref:hypothetical protein n=1 Tax=Amphibacillus sp. Q70 TaxID=3453416 RepID=UPI003F85A581